MTKIITYADSYELTRKYAVEMCCIVSKLCTFIGELLHDDYHLTIFFRMRSILPPLNDNINLLCLFSCNDILNTAIYVFILPR